MEEKDYAAIAAYDYSVCREQGLSWESYRTVLILNLSEVEGALLSVDKDGKS